MTEPRTPDDRPSDAGSTSPPTDPAAPGADPPRVGTDAAESPTQAWPSPSSPAPATGPGPANPAWPAAGLPFEPAESLPSTRVGMVGDGRETDATGVPAAPRRGRSNVRWVLALVGVLIVAAGSFAIVSLVGGRPSTSGALGYMPATTVTYQEVRLDLPGDQRQKLAGFLQTFPGFADQSAIEPKIDEVFDRIVRAASKDQQTWTTDIKPWFGGQIGVGASVPDATDTSLAGMAGASNSLVAVTITDRAKAIAWLTKSAGTTPLAPSTYGGADLFTGSAPADSGSTAEITVAVNDKVMLGGSTAAVKAAIDSGGKGTLDQDPDVKAAIATLDKDFVVFSVIRTRAYVDAAVKVFQKTQPGVLESSQLDETLIAMVPAWQATTARFESDAIVTTSVGPSVDIGYDAANRASEVVGHVPAKTVVYLDSHDAGPALTAVLAKFRALPEAKPAFDQVDQVLNLLGGPDAVYGWWGDSAVVVTPLADGTLGAGLVIHPKDADKATRLFTTIDGFLALAGSSTGVATRTEDHNGTKVTIVDFSGVPGMSTSGLPAGYKAEFAWAANKDVAVLGYGKAFVEAVLDAGPGASLGDDARFKGFLARVGPENLGVAFVDISAIRGLVEPLAQAAAPADAWTRYVTDIQPYLKPLDVLISNVRKDGAITRSSGALTVH